MEALTKYTDTPGPIALIWRADLARSTKQLYVGVLCQFIASGGNLASRDDLREYAESITPSRRATLKSALSVWTREAIAELESRVTPQTLHETQATIMRLRRLGDGIKTRASHRRGKMAHTWLSAEQIEALREACAGDDIVSVRDRLVLGMLLTTGCRRAELCALKWEHLVQIPNVGLVANIVQGKGGKDRSIPLTPAIVQLLDEWAAFTGRDGFVLRSLGMSQIPGASLSVAGVHNIIKARGRKAGIPALQVHDLRRTFLQAVWERTKDLLLCADLAGHSSIETTRRYLTIDAGKKRDAVEAITWGPPGNA